MGAQSCCRLTGFSKYIKTTTTTTISSATRSTLSLTRSLSLSLTLPSPVHVFTHPKNPVRRGKNPVASLNGTENAQTYAADAFQYYLKPIIKSSAYLTRAGRRSIRQRIRANTQTRTRARQTCEMAGRKIIRALGSAQVKSPRLHKTSRKKGNRPVMHAAPRREIKRRRKRKKHTQSRKGDCKFDFNRAALWSAHALNNRTRSLRSGRRRRCDLGNPLICRHRARLIMRKYTRAFLLPPRRRRRRRHRACSRFAVFRFIARGAK